ncbi:MAG: sulfatase-like hydrolase/transferase [Deltaproteobacteria bacterium]|nr:sulfatase-like hydrolase/transferase [Deltaproteobacteria bacterium]
MASVQNATRCAGMGASFGMAFLGSEELLNVFIGAPLRLGELVQVLPFYVLVPAVLGAILGAIGFQGIAAAIWIWGGFTLWLSVGPAAEILTSAGLPGVIGVVLAGLAVFATVILMLFLSRDRDELRWGFLAAGWVVVLFGGAVQQRLDESTSLISIGLNLGLLLMGVAISLGVAKALGHRQPRAGVMAALLGMLVWLGRVTLAPTMVEPIPAPAPSTTPSAQPPILLLVVSGLRADHMGFFGASAENTPALDELAARSITYDQAQSASPSRLPALASIFTGQLPSSHGLTPESPALSPSARTLAEYLQAKGYSTGAILADPSVSVATGLNQGFRHFDARPGLSHRPLLLTTLNLLNAPVLLTRNRRPAATVVTEAQSFLSVQGQTPFFLVVQLADLMPPYDGPSELIGDQDVVDVEGRYTAKLRALDADIKRLIDATPKGTWIIVTSDHGIALSEREARYPNQPRAPGVYVGDTMYQEQLRVPLVFFKPRNLKPYTALRPARAYDILPTVLKIIQERALEGMDGELLHEVIGSAPEEDLLEVLVSEANSVGEPMRAVRSGPWKLIEGPEGAELYNLIMDPGETMNLASQSPEIAKELSWLMPGSQRPADAPKFSLDETTRRRLDGEEGLLPVDGAVVPTPEGQPTTLPTPPAPGAPGALPPPTGL